MSETDALLRRCDAMHAELALIRQDMEAYREEFAAKMAPAQANLQGQMSALREEMEVMRVALATSGGDTQSADAVYYRMDTIDEAQRRREGQ